ncbi:unnamed protein product [Echinostoma caproni]|uniref:WS_DGAT_C domain-containing protein n=1 Tax=Echinostoma caproni TaxID=27848 RepID=A0A183AXP6_9TREM|nr:unnamed protein product [Echinostoma caproni]
MDNVLCPSQAAVFSDVKLTTSKLFFNITANGSGRDLVFQMFVKAEVDILKAINLVKKAWMSVHPYVSDPSDR